LDEGYNLFESIKKTVEILQGAYSFVLISILDPEAMYIVKNTGTMVIGFPDSLKSKKGDDLNKLEAISDMSSEKDEEEKNSHKF